MRTLIIDNYDSFTINLYQLIAKVNQEEPLVIRNDQYNWSDLQDLRFDNIVISPGPGSPTQDGDFGICQQILKEARVPLLGVCLGHQGLGYVYGGTITYAPEVMHGRLSNIYHNDSQIFTAIPQGFQAVRYHSLIVANDLPPALEKIAWTDQGLIMGLRHRHLPFWGVQFHPESISTEYGSQLLQNFRDITQQLAVKKYYTSQQSAHSIIPQKKPLHQRDTSAEFELASRKIETLFKPEQVFTRLFCEASNAFWLDSSLAEPGRARFSYMGDNSGPLSALVKYNTLKKEITVCQHGLVSTFNEDIFEYLEREQAQRHISSCDLPFDFNSGFVGYFGYELKYDCGATLKYPSSLPDALFLLADRMVVFDHLERAIYLVCLVNRGDKRTAESWFEHIERQLCTRLFTQTIANPRPELPTFHLARPREAYLRDIQQCMHYLKEGESYELCLTNKIYAHSISEPLELYKILRCVNPAPYSAFLRFGEVSILSSSPERFLHIDCTGHVESKPIKGTRPRGNTEKEDELLSQQLASSDKDRAENLMIVDLIRNDLGLVCDVGSVGVDKYMCVETYKTVHQLVSTIRGHLREGISPLECIRKAFPGGSMTGAPKLRTMELLENLERQPREIYSGAIGYVGFDGSVDLNIVIRTIVVTPTATTIGVGGAIVALSDPDDEFDEILLKAQALVHSIMLYSQGSFDTHSYEHFKASMKSKGRVLF